jgi:hypothetical protein
MSNAFRTTSGTREVEAPEDTPTPAETWTATPVPTGSTATPTPGGDTPTPRPTATAQTVTLQELQDELFTPLCATQFCHSAQVRSGGLVLEAGESFANLVGVEASNVAARAAGMPRVDPFAPDNSFLITKLVGPPGSAYGARMPLIGDALREEEIDLIRRWILAGAEGGP